MGFRVKSIYLIANKYRHNKRPLTKIDGLFDGPSDWIRTSGRAGCACPPGSGGLKRAFGAGGRWFGKQI